ELTLDDGVQPPVTLWSAERDLLAATFTQLLIANCGGEDSFKVRAYPYPAGAAGLNAIPSNYSDGFTPLVHTVPQNKQDFFYSEVRKAHWRHPHEKLALRVARSELVRSSLKATKSFAIADWCKNFDVCFQGEQGVDWGGVRREWFSLLCAQLFDAKGGLFVSCHDSPAGLVHPNPDRPPHFKLKHFEFAGKIVGKCLYESALGGAYRQLVRARLARSFLAQIIGLRVHYKSLTKQPFDLPGAAVVVLWFKVPGLIPGLGNLGIYFRIFLSALVYMGVDNDLHPLEKRIEENKYGEK
ncbi:jg6437, partial [Pararge aegeria aegeria]